jgi:hypothetical protein
MVYSVEMMQVGRRARRFELAHRRANRFERLALSCDPPDPSDQGGDNHQARAQ